MCLIEISSDMMVSFDQYEHNKRSIHISSLTFFWFKHVQDFWLDTARSICDMKNRINIEVAMENWMNIDVET